MEEGWAGLAWRFSGWIRLHTGWVKHIREINSEGGNEWLWLHVRDSWGEVVCIYEASLAKN